MKKNPDIKTAGRSELAPYIPGESAEDRHRRRLRVAEEYREEVKAFCRNYEIRFILGNYNHHWTFQFGDTVVEWWPSSAKMVLDRKYKEGIHVHDPAILMRKLKGLLRMMATKP